MPCGSYRRQQAPPLLPSLHHQTRFGSNGGPINHYKVHAFQGEVILGVTTLVHVPDNCFNHATQVQVTTVMNTKALLVADATITSFGPFLNSDADTTAARTHKLCAIPAKYAGFFLSRDEGVEPRHFMNELLPCH